MFRQTKNLTILRHYFKQITVQMSSNTTPSKDLYSVRVPYDTDKPLTREDLVSLTNPLEQFHDWFDQMQSCKVMTEPNAMCLSTSSLSGQPSSRMVLLKHYSDKGFKFFTNYESHKANDLAENPKASLLFYWGPLHRQIRIEGTVNRLSEEESRQYFSLRPVGSQISAIVSPQSREIASRSEIQEKHNIAEKELTPPLTKPDYWGGYALIPFMYEFWQGHRNRLHDRLVYKKNGDTWTVVRLAP